MKNTIITIVDDVFRVCISISEFKRFVNENIFELPLILKDEKKIIVDPMLYYQMFFIGTR